MLAYVDGVHVVQSNMTMQEAAQLLASGEAACSEADCIVDLSQVAAADSSAVAVVLGWVRQAQRCGKRLTLRAPPASFMSLSALYDVDEILKPYLEHS